MVSERFVVPQAKDFGQADLPRRVARELDVGAEENQQVGFGHDALGELGVDEFLGDVAGRELALLGHVGEGACEIDNRFAAVLGRNEAELEMAYAGGVDDR